MRLVEDLKIDRQVPARETIFDNLSWSVVMAVNQTISDDLRRQLMWQPIDYTRVELKDGAKHGLY